MGSSRGAAAGARAACSNRGSRKGRGISCRGNSSRGQQQGQQRQQQQQQRQQQQQGQQQQQQQQQQQHRNSWYDRQRHRHDVGDCGGIFLSRLPAYVVHHADPVVRRRTVMARITILVRRRLLTSDVYSRGPIIHGRPFRHWIACRGGHGTDESGDIWGSCCIFGKIPYS